MAEKQPKEDMKSAGFTLKAITLRKLKYISAVDDRFQNEILEEALNEFFTR